MRQIYQVSWLVLVDNVKLNKMKGDWIQELFVKEMVVKQKPTDFYYYEDGKKVFTEEFHKQRGVCCGSNCRHCPFDPVHIKGTKNLKNQNSDQ